mmetsp:Transcript_25224/g.32910  ORF Transcript_25224/g.32910 Transcript_25224/m.32910 type:complete len:702 (-) Transcript_25224:144-2249(-)
MEGDALQLPDLGIVGKSKAMHSTPPSERVAQEIQALSSSPFTLKMAEDMDMDTSFDTGSLQGKMLYPRRDLNKVDPSSFPLQQPLFSRPQVRLQGPSRVPVKMAPPPAALARKAHMAAPPTTAMEITPLPVSTFKQNFSPTPPPQSKLPRSGWQSSPKTNFTGGPSKKIQQGWQVPKNNFTNSTQVSRRKKRPAVRRPRNSQDSSGNEEQPRNSLEGPDNEGSLQRSSIDLTDCKSPSPTPLKPHTPCYMDSEKMWTLFQETFRGSAKNMPVDSSKHQREVKILEPVLRRNRSASASEATGRMSKTPEPIIPSVQKPIGELPQAALSAAQRRASSRAIFKDQAPPKDGITTVSKPKTKLRPVLHVKYRKWASAAETDCPSPPASTATPSHRQHRRQRQKFNDASWRAIRRFKHKGKTEPGKRRGSLQRGQLMGKLRRNVICTEIDSLGSVVVGRQDKLRAMEDDLGSQYNFVLPSLDSTIILDKTGQEELLDASLGSPEQDSMDSPSKFHYTVLCEHHSSNVKRDKIEMKKRSIEYGNQASVIFKYEDELKRVAREKVTEFKNLVGCERASVFLADRTTKSLYLMPVESTKWIKLPMAEGIAGYTVSQGVTLNIPDAYDDPRFNQSVDKKFGLRTKSILCVPLREKVAASNVVGCIQMINKIGEEDFFNHEDEMVMEMCASKLTEIMAQYGLKMLMKNNKF